MIVEIRGLTKVYEEKQRVVAIDGIDLSVEQGEIFGLLGPNGAGKTTTISIATTRALPTSGQVTIAGVDVVAKPATARRNIGVVPQYNTLDRSLTVFENLYFHCRYFGFSSTEAKTRAQQLLSQFHLQERGASFPAQLSGRLAATGTNRARHRPSPGRTLPRRAQRGAGSAEQNRHVGCGERIGRRRNHRGADYPLHGRSR